MKTGFYLDTRNQDKELYINLHGVFDESSAFELISTIEKNQVKSKLVFIDTTHLTHTAELGKTALDSLLPNNAFRARLHFSGIRARDILPEGCILLKSKKPKSHKCKGTCKNCRCRKTDHASTLPVHPE